MAVSRKTLRDRLRASYLDKLVALFEADGEEVLRTASNEIALPCVDSEGNEDFVVVTVKVPTGSRDGEAYDGYSMAEEYQIKEAEKIAKVKEAAEKKARKIARDKAQREQLAKAKAEREAKKNGEGA